MIPLPQHPSRAWLHGAAQPGHGSNPEPSSAQITKNPPNPPTSEKPNLSWQPIDTILCLCGSLHLDGLVKLMFYCCNSYYCQVPYQRTCLHELFAISAAVNSRICSPQTSTVVHPQGCFLKRRKHPVVCAVRAALRGGEFGMGTGEHPCAAASPGHVLGDMSPAVRLWRSSVVLNPKGARCRQCHCPGGWGPASLQHQTRASKSQTG